MHNIILFWVLNIFKSKFQNLYYDHFLNYLQQNSSWKYFFKFHFGDFLFIFYFKQLLCLLINVYIYQHYY